MFDYFKRSFQKYLTIRRLVKGIIDETNKRNVNKQEGYLRSFKDRKAPRIITDQEKTTFEYECFYKCF